VIVYPVLRGFQPVPYVVQNEKGYRIFMRKTVENSHSEDISIDGKIILK
jgi:hypothetical protein